MERKRVLIATDVDFWRRDAGDKSRIFELTRYLSRHTDLLVAYLGPYVRDDEQLLWDTGFPFQLFFLGDDRPRSAFEYAHRFRSLLTQFSADVCCLAHAGLSYLLDLIPEGVHTLVDLQEPIRDRDAGFFLPPGRSVSEPGSRPIAEVFARIRSIDTAILSEPREYEQARRALGPDRVVFAPHPVSSPRRSIRPAVRAIGFVGGASRANADALSWFLHHVWPAVRPYDVPLYVYGRVNEVVAWRGPGVTPRGFVPRQDDIYDEVDVLINPVRGGDGPKVKSVEALGNGLPLVTTSPGATGLEEAAGTAFLVANDADAFSTALVDVLSDFGLRCRLGDAAYAFARRHHSPDACFRDLLRHIERSGVRGRTAGGSRAPGPDAYHYLF